MSEQSVERGQVTGNLWLSLWVLSVALIGQGALEVIELGGRWPLWLASVAPIILFLFGVSRDICNGLSGTAYSCSSISSVRLKMSSPAPIT